MRYRSIGWTVLFVWLVAAAKAQDSVSVIEPSIPAAERAALLQLFEATDGAHWTNASGWLAQAGTECQWYGVSCSYSDIGTPRVSALILEENNMRGQVPAALADLSQLHALAVDRNHLSGALPAPLLAKFDDGRLRVVGYAGQFSPIIEVRLTMTPGGVICGDYDIRIVLGGEITWKRKRCSDASPEDRATFWETGVGTTDDLDRIVRLIETSGFLKLSPSYERSVTHGSSEIVTITYRDKTTRSVEDYGRQAPAPMWLIKQVILGAAFDAAQIARRVTE